VEPEKRSLCYIPRSGGAGNQTNLPEYGEFMIDEINLTTQMVIFSNGTEIAVGNSQGAAP
jgi:hypothetical protein